MRINFVMEILAMHQYAKAKAVTSGERHLWWALFFLFNASASGSEWPDGFLSFSNKTILAEVPYGEDSLLRARSKLVKRGVIAYRPGRKNSLCPMYKIHYLTAIASEHSPDMAAIPHFAGNLRGNPAGNLAGKCGGNILPYTVGKPADIPLNLKGEPNEAIHTDNGYDSAWRTSARARGAVAQRIIQQWGGDPSGGFDLHGDLVYYLEQGMTPEAIETVLRGCDAACYARDHLENAAIYDGLIIDPDITTRDAK